MRGSNPINLSNPYILCDKLEILKWCNIFKSCTKGRLAPSSFLGVIGPGFAMCYPLLPANTTTFSPPLLFISRNRKPAEFARTNFNYVDKRLNYANICHLFLCVCSSRKGKLLLFCPNPVIPPQSQGILVWQAKAVNHAEEIPFVSHNFTLSFQQQCVLAWNWQPLPWSLKWTKFTDFFW